jgi:predicted aspartyl protease
MEICPSTEGQFLFYTCPKPYLRPMLLFHLLLTFISFLPGKQHHNARPEQTHIHVIPLKRAGNLLLIEATVDSITGDFILDTGAPYPVINATYFRNLYSGIKQQSAGVGGTAVASEQITLKSLTFGGISYRNISGDIASLAQLENKTKTKILGLLGTSLFAKYKIQLDVNKNQLILFDLDEYGNPLASLPPDSTNASPLSNDPAINIKFKLCDNKIVVPVDVANKQMNWIFDTGAESNVVDALSSKKILKEFVVLRRINMTGTAGAKQEVFLGYFNEISVGQQTFPMQQTVLVGMQELNQACSVFIDGILGYSFFSQGIVTMNFMTKDFSLYLYLSE